MVTRRRTTAALAGAVLTAALTTFAGPVSPASAQPARSATEVLPVHTPLVVGLDQATAQRTIVAARLTVGAVTGVLDRAVPGTVLRQNPPAGSLLAEQSPVQLLVSLGAVTVPAVLGDTRVAAVTAINAAGLRVGRLIPVDTCVDPGTVQAQRPAAGTVVVPGSTVDLTVSTCVGGQPK